MFNLAGEVIGVNTAIFSPSGGSVGIGFAPPSSMAKNIIAQLRATGEVRRGWPGVRIQTVPDQLAGGLPLDPARGPLVAPLTETGPAQQAGLARGDGTPAIKGRAVTGVARTPATS